VKKIFHVVGSWYLSSVHAVEDFRNGLTQIGELGRTLKQFSSESTPYDHVQLQSSPLLGLMDCEEGCGEAKNTFAVGFAFRVFEVPSADGFSSISLP
jgi:hypothetical protein